VRGDLVETADRARAWRRSLLEAVCDLTEPWEHGTVMRASRYPSYYDYNVVQVEGDPVLSAEELIGVADARLGDLEHRRLDFDRADAAERVRAELAAAHWEPTRLVWMLHSEPVPPGPSVAVEEVDYDAVLDLRRAWHAEDFPDLDSHDYLDNAREIATTRRTRVIATREGDELVGFAQVEQIAGGAEITSVYVGPEHRGDGRGTALTRAAIEAAGDVDELWIVADDEGRPKQLYARLGFRPAWTSTEFLRAPGIAGWTGY
jgi:ribosomal protein S18 acetylase RimI-like enzyme